jgi:hypothetical protein
MSTADVTEARPLIRTELKVKTPNTALQILHYMIDLKTLALLFPFPLSLSVLIWFFL